MGGGWKRPDLPEGALKDLNDELHELHGLSGHRTTREIERWLRRKYGDEAPSHTKIHQVFTRPTLSNPELVLRIVRELALRIRSVNEEDECDRFDALWRAAYEEQLHRKGRRRRDRMRSAGDDLSATAQRQSQVERISRPAYVVEKVVRFEQAESRDPALPELRTSRAVFVGVDRLGMGSLARKGVEQLSELLTQPSGTFLSANTIKSINPTKDELLEHLQEAADGAEDTLFFYYAGRSRMSRDGLQLDTSDMQPYEGHLAAYDPVREILTSSRALRKVIILECSSHVEQVLQAASFQQPEAGHALTNPSTYVIAATGVPTVAADGGGRYLPFAGTLIEVLREGLPGESDLLTVDVIVDKIQRQFPPFDFRGPECSIHNDRGFALARNPYMPGVGRSSPLSPSSATWDQT